MFEESETRETPKQLTKTKILLHSIKSQKTSSYSARAHARALRPSKPIYVVLVRLCRIHHRWGQNVNGVGSGVILELHLHHLHVEVVLLGLMILKVGAHFLVSPRDRGGGVGQAAAALDVADH